VFQESDVPGLVLVLDEQEQCQVVSLADDLARSVRPAVNHDFIRDIPAAAQELPVRVRKALLLMRQREDPAFAHICGVRVDDDAIGPTPAHWHDTDADERTMREQVVLMLFGSMLGELFGWESQQEGSIIHNVLPISQYENTQINFASKEPIWWHTEDAFHDFRPDYVGLFCLRNPVSAATTVSCVSEWDLRDPKFGVLFEDRFFQVPDNSHGSCQEAAVSPRPVLLGDRRRPYVCIDPYFLKRPDDPKIAEVLDDFCETVSRSLREVVLGPGEALFVDNYLAVHGRQPFHASYDGKDRWLKRALISRDLRRCWPVRTKASRQVLVGAVSC